MSGYERDLVSLNDRAGGFVDISGVSGADSIRDSRSGSAFADLDNDGDMDIIKRPSTTRQPDPALQLYRNNLGQQAGSLTITLQGDPKRTGLDAWGAVVRVKTTQGTLTQVKAAGSGFMSQWDPRLQFGLGGDAKAESVEVTWPHGGKQVFGPQAAGAAVVLVEGDAKARAVEVARGSLPDGLDRQARDWRSLTLKKGDALPAWDLKDLADEETTLGAVLPAGRGVLVTFWATWCDSCKAEMPELQQYFASKGVQVVGLNVEGEFSGDIEGFIADAGVTFPIYRMALEDAEAAYADGGMALPLSILVDPKGAVTDVFLGSAVPTRRRLRARLEAVGGP